MILTEASLSFLGLGIRPPQSSWGLMLAQGRGYVTSAWWLVTFPGLVILLTRPVAQSARDLGAGGHRSGHALAVPGAAPNTPRAK